MLQCSVRKGLWETEKCTKSNRMQRQFLLNLGFQVSGMLNASELRDLGSRVPWSPSPPHHGFQQLGKTLNWKPWNKSDHITYCITILQNILTTEWWHLIGSIMSKLISSLSFLPPVLSVKMVMLCQGWLWLLPLHSQWVSLNISFMCYWCGKVTSCFLLFAFSFHFFVFQSVTRCSFCFSWMMSFPKNFKIDLFLLVDACSIFEDATRLVVS